MNDHKCNHWHHDVCHILILVMAPAILIVAALVALASYAVSPQ